MRKHESQLWIISYPQSYNRAFTLARTKEWQLFDLVKDPQEMKSVHEDPEYAEIFVTMKNRYQELRTEFNVPEGMPK
jgi:hypothetical protein